MRQESRQSSWGGSWGGRWVGLGHLNNLDDGIRNLVLEVQLLGNANARAVELSNKVGVLTVNLVSKDEIGGPDQWNWHALHSQARHDLWKILVHEVIHELLEHRIIRLVRDVLGAGLEGSGDAALSWLLVHNLGWLVVNHVHAELSLNNTWQEALVNQLTVLTNNVLLAEGHEVIKSLLLLVVVDSLLQVQDGGSGDLSLLSLLDLAHPDALTLRAAVLLHHPDSGGNALWEVLLEAWDVVVGVGVRHTTRQVGNLDKGILGSHLLHHVWMLHGGNASGGSLSEHLINLALGDSRVSSWVDPGDETISSHHKGLDLVILGIRVVDWHARPVLLDQSVGDWDGISPMSVSLLVAASLTLNEDDLSSRVLWLRQESWQGWCRRHLHLGLHRRRSWCRGSCRWRGLLWLWSWGIHILNWSRGTTTHCALFTS